MGDLLFIYKHFMNGVLDSYRGILVQAKYTKGKRRAWKVATKQFYFLAQWPIFEIVKPRFNKRYLIKPRALTWSAYGFVGQNATRYPIYYSSDRMARHKGGIPSTKSFTFHVKSDYSWDCSRSFLMKFAQGLVGENLLINQNTKSLVDDLYVVMGWKPDPPGEPKWDDVSPKDDEGFGIVELTVSSEGKES